MFYVVNAIVAVGASLAAKMSVGGSALFLATATGAILLVALWLLGSLSGRQVWLGVGTWVVVGLAVSAMPASVLDGSPGDAAERDGQAENGPAAKTPEAVIEDFYAALDTSDYKLAYSKWGKQFRRTTSFEEFEGGFDRTQTHENLSTDRVVDEDTQLKKYHVNLDAVERTAQGIKTTPQTWLFEMIEEDGEWRIHDATQL
ncbi:MAG: hypothetical protein ACE5E0_04110 [Terriglobia bacterium]